MSPAAGLIMTGYRNFSKLIWSDFITNVTYSSTLVKRLSIQEAQALCYSSSANVLELVDSEVQKPKKEKVSKAMRSYLERARQHDELIKQQLHDYKVGRRHLANMMGEDPETFSQKDIDAAIAYLFPSGLFDPRARPQMKHPDEVFPKRKAAEFDASGRPYHTLFYAGKPNFYQLLYDIVSHMQSLNAFEDKMIIKQIKPDASQALNLSGSQWLPQEDLQKQVMETIKEREYEQFVNAMERLAHHPYAYRLEEFIMNHRRQLMGQVHSDEIPKPEYDADGRAFVTTKHCLRKRAHGEVTIRSPGTGKFSINGKDIDYFAEKQPREQILFPLVFAGMLGHVDVEAKVTGGGPSGQAGAVRWGISMGLRSFVEEDVVERMRIAGLLQRDYRTRERKKPGQEGARRKFTWKKR